MAGTPVPLSSLALVVAGAVAALVLAWLVLARWRWWLARERALAERFRTERDEALAAHRQAAEALAAAERAGAAQARGLASISHDLRQPAQALGLYLAALQTTAGVRDDAEAAELAARLRAALVSLETLLAGALDVSRLDAGAVVPQWSPVALAPLLRRLADEWALAAQARGLRLALHLGDADALAVTDPGLLERVLRNLLANAVHHTRQGGVLLACRLRRSGAGQRLWRIEVWDSGVGIAPADQERVFEAFEQIGAGNGRKPGQGLGLAIVRRLAAVLQLQVVLHSRPGRGSVFFIDGLVPAGRAPGAKPAQPMPDTARP